MKKFMILLMTITLLCVLSGCWGKKDLDQMTITLAIGIDKKEDGFELTVQVMNPFVLGQNPLDQASVVAISQEGKTIFEAIRKMSKTVTGRLFIAHFDIIAFGEDLAKEGIEKYLKFFLSDPEAQHKKTVIIVKGDTAKNLLKVQTMLNLIPSISMYQKVGLSEEVYGITHEILVTTTYSQIESPNIDPVISGLEIKGDVEKGAKNDNTKSTTPDAVFSSVGLSVFKGDKLVGWLNEQESMGFNHIMGNMKTFVVPAKMDKNTLISFEGFKVKSKRSIKLIDNKPKVFIDYQMTGRIGEVMDGRLEHSSESFQHLQSKISEEVKKMMEACLEKALKEYNSDIFGFGELIHRQEPKYWKQNKKNHYEILKELEYEIKVKTNIIDVLD